MNATKPALTINHDYIALRSLVGLAVTRDNAAGLVADLEPAFGYLIQRALRAHLTVAENKELQLLFGVCRRRCQSLLPQHSGLQEEVRTGFNAARHLVDLWMAPPVCREEHTPAEEPYAKLLLFYWRLKAMRQDRILSTLPKIDPFAPCTMIPFPKPRREAAR